MDEGTLQAYLDRELAGAERAETAEHVLGCTRCRQELDDLRRANARLATALAEVDIPPPAPRVAPAVSPLRSAAFGGRSLVRAAVLLLCLAAAAAAAAPGSPVREWIVEAVRPERAAPVAEVEPVPAVQPAAEPPGPAGLSIPGLRNVEVSVTGFQDGQVRLVRAEGAGVAVSAQGAATDPSFRLGDGRIEVVGGEGGEVLVEVPDGVTARLVVDDRLYAEMTADSLRTLVPGDPVDDGVVWP